MDKSKRPGINDLAFAEKDGTWTASLKAEPADYVAGWVSTSGNSFISYDFGVDENGLPMQEVEILPMLAFLPPQGEC